MIGCAGREKQKTDIFRRNSGTFKSRVTRANGEI
jgi:hypothetical protein